MVFDDGMLKVADRFNSRRAMANTRAIWEQARRMDAAAFRAAVDVAAGRLRDAGIEDVRVEEVPADGETSVNGWIMPVTWEVRDARLETAGRRGAREVLADFGENPQSLAPFSPATTRSGWRTGSVVSCTNPMKSRADWRGKFVLLPEGGGSFDICERAARRGAIAVLTVSRLDDPDASRYLNYAVPLDAERPCVPVFSLCPRAGESLRRRLADEPDVTLRARVRATRRKGTMPVLTGVVGSGNPEITVCGHIDEIGAFDNASGCGTAIEALRVLQSVSASPRYGRQRRAVRYFFSCEVRGMQAWLAALPGVFVMSESRYGRRRSGVRVLEPGGQNRLSSPSAFFRSGVAPDRAADR